MYVCVCADLCVIAIGSNLGTIGVCVCVYRLKCITQAGAIIRSTPICRDF